jgi:hypothetical protein
VDRIRAGCDRGCRANLRRTTLGRIVESQEIVHVFQNKRQGDMYPIRVKKRTRHGHQSRAVGIGKGLSKAIKQIKWPFVSDSL